MDKLVGFLSTLDMKLRQQGFLIKAAFLIIMLCLLFIVLEAMLDWKMLGLDAMKFSERGSHRLAKFFWLLEKGEGVLALGFSSQQVVMVC